ncbi:hypothetical protein DH2020_027469 [Rehmannia glutinosa]|uniref:Serine/threonine-protein phosphatase 4 regulatory subunit 3-like protein n=1 Tax=Rehmannia glutinosa TaxID=99300 RepID=A0ABR0VXX8_REHGL
MADKSPNSNSMQREINSLYGRHRIESTPLTLSILVLEDFCAATATKTRVKVYRLNEDGKWDDQGTGHVTVDYLERSEDLGLYVIDEEDNETLLLHRISSDDIYRKQEDTIISWRDPEFSTELALSFQETTGDHICSLQRTMQFSSLARGHWRGNKFILDMSDHDMSDQEEGELNISCAYYRRIYIPLFLLIDETFHNINSELKLPPVELSTLPLILKIVESGIADQLRVTELILHDILVGANLSEAYWSCSKIFRKLMELFRICDDLENVDGLHLIFKIVRGIILLNSPPIFEKIFGDELIMDIMGCLEYDPEVPQADHRNFLKEHVVFKEAIPIKDPVVLSKIHQTYRIGYLKDVILPRALDEGVVANFNSIIHSNNAIVVSLLKDDSTFIKELFARMKSPTTSVESKKTLFSVLNSMKVHFLHEFCTLSKSLQMVHQHRLFRDLVSEGIFDIIADVLQSEDKKLMLTGTDILVLFQNLDSNFLRSYVTRQDGVLFGLLVKNMLTDFGDDMHWQFVEIIRSLLDPLTPGSQRESIVEIFHEKHLGQLIDVITSSCPQNSDGQMDSNSVSSDGGSRSQSSVKPEILLNICDLLCFCVLQHPYRIKCNFLLNNVIDKVLYLTRRREKYLVVAAIRFMRALVSRSDEHLMNHLVKNNLFQPIIDAFVANGHRYNLLNSAVLDLVEYIRQENKKVLLRYLVDTFWDQLAKFESISSIHALKVKYEQSLESMDTTNTGSLLDQRKRLDERALEKEEEDYFNEDSFKRGDRAKKVTTVSKGLKPRGVFAALCSTLSETVLPSKKVATTALNNNPSNVNQNSIEPNVEEKGSIGSSKNAEIEDDNDKEEASRSFTDGLDDSADNMMHGDECSLFPPKSSPEMVVNGS